MSITVFPHTNRYKLKPFNTTPHAATQRSRYIIPSNLRLRPPLVSDHLTSAPVFQSTKSLQAKSLYLEPLVSDHLS